MDYSTAHSKRASRGWWRVLCGVLFVVAATLGLGFYLPLRESHRLLNVELASARSAHAELTQNLERTEAHLKRITSERDELAGFKDEVDSKRRQYPGIVEQLENTASPQLKSAFEKKRIHARALSDGVSLGWTSPALLNWKRTAPTITGQALLCPTLAETTKLGLSEVTVRTFIAADAAPSELKDALSAATELASALGDQLLRVCKLPPAALSVASSLATKESPLLQFEFRKAPSAHGSQDVSGAPTVANR